MFGLLLLVLGTALGMALQWQPTTPPTAKPRDGQSPSDAPAHPAEGDFRRTGSSSEPGDAPPTEGDRLAVPSETPTRAPASLVVRVVARPAEGAAVAVPWTDVAVELDGDHGTRRIACTDHEGNASFAFAAAAGRQVRVVGGIGGFVEAELQPGEQRLELTIVPRAIAIGKVIDRAGRAVGGADLVLLRWSDDGDDGPHYRIGRSGPDGQFRIPLAVGGRLGAVAPPHAPSALHLLRAAPAGRVLQQNFELVLFGDAATVRGVVVDGDARPVAGARIRFDSLEPRPAGSERAAPPQRFTANAQGEFVAAGLTPGLLAISAWADDYGWTRDELRVGSDEAFVTLRLPWPSRVIGTVETEDGNAGGGRARHRQRRQRLAAGRHAQRPRRPLHARRSRQRTCAIARDQRRPERAGRTRPRTGQQPRVARSAGQQHAGPGAARRRARRRRTAAGRLAGRGRCEGRAAALDVHR